MQHTQVGASHGAVRGAGGGGSPATNTVFGPTTSRVRELTGLVLVSFVALAAVKLSEAAGWMELPRLTPLCLVALFTSAILAKTRIPAGFKYVVAAVTGSATVLAFGASAIAEETWSAKVTTLAKRLDEWWTLATAGETAKDNLPLVLLLLAVMWLIAYLSVWLFLVQRRKWLAVLPSAAWILLNVRYVPLATSSYYAVYIAALILFLVHIRLRESWRHSQRLIFLALLLAISVPILAVSWKIPRVAISSYLGTLKTETESKWGRLETAFNRYFSPNPAVETNAPPPGSPLHTFGPEMVLKGNLNVPESRVMTVNSPVAGYFRGATYEVYTGSGWKQIDPAGPAVGRRLDIVEDDYQMRRQINQTVSVGSTTDVIFAIGQPLSTSLTAVGLFPTPMSFTIPLDGNPAPLNLPPDVRVVAHDLATYYAQRAPGAKRGDPGRPSRPSTPGFTVRRLVRDGGNIKAIEIVRQEPDIPDILGLRSPIAMKPGTKYTIVSSLSSTTYVELREAGENYPSWITDRYLQLPKNLPESVKQLAYQVAQPAENPYDRALAVETYLRQLDYNTHIKTPPADMDVVEYFLFRAPEGYCNYFATAMVVMLRSVGVPARMAVGFNNGEYDLEQEAWIVKESNAHAWPEVYFPQYGWVEFEPTPSQPPLGHEPPSSILEEEEPEIDFAPEPAEEEGWGARETGLSVLSTIAMMALVGVVAWHFTLRRLPSPSKVYVKMLRLGFLARIRRRPSETPLEYSRKLAEELPEHAREIETIAGIYTRTTFGKKTLAVAEHQQLTSSWIRLRKALLRRAFLSY
ncbi:MAG: transglutaminase domain-containing protein [Chloroflexi bacterium]|nr:transglutaminase domain-containing protein [Chloroflexota bacterium]